MAKKQLIFVDEPHIQSLAALFLLQFQLRDESLQQYFSFRDEYFSQFDELVCFWCGKRHLDKDTENLKELATIDHIIPVSKGGIKMDRNNCLVSCHKCNSRRGNMDFLEFYEIKKETANPLLFLKYMGIINS